MGLLHPRSLALAPPGAILTNGSPALVAPAAMATNEDGICRPRASCAGRRCGRSTRTTAARPADGVTAAATGLTEARAQQVQQLRDPYATVRALRHRAPGAQRADGWRRRAGALGRGGLGSRRA